jgi:gliding motility-associatede transport system auxiliary component
MKGLPGKVVGRHMKKYKKYIMLSIELLIAVSLVISVEMAMSKVGLSLDMTPNLVHSLSMRSKEILDSLNSPLSIKIFVKKEGEQERIRTLLALYRNRNALVTYELINMDRQPGLARKYNVHSYYTTILEYGHKTEKTGFPSEKNISDTLAKLLGKENPSVCFITRPGAKNINKQQGDEHGLDFAEMRLITAGYKVKKVSLNGIPGISGNTCVIVVSGPTVDYDESETDLLRNFINAGGRVLFFLGPVPLPNLEKLLEEYGISLPRKIIVDQEGHPQEWDDYTIVVPFIDRRHAIALGIDLPGVFPLCRPVQIEVYGKKPGTELIATGKTSWATSAAMNVREAKDFNPELDQQGPITVGVTREIFHENGKVGKIAVYGNSSFFDNTYIKLLGNGKLFVNTIHWATQDDLVNQQDEVDYGNTLFLSTGEFREIQLFCLLLPLMTMTIGCIISFMRRRR